MSDSSELRLNGHIDFDVLFEMVKLLFDKGAKKNFKVDNLGPIAELDDVKEVYGESKDYETEFGWISFTYEGEKRFLNYQYRNINTYEGLRYYEKLGAADMSRPKHPFCGLATGSCGKHHGDHHPLLWRMAGGT